MIQKKNFVMAIKRALQSGGFNYVGQQAKQFPDQLWKIQQLKIEDQNWWECNPITKIDVSNNQISAIPEGIINMADVQVLRMKNNLCKQIPVCLFKLANLKSIDLNRNKLQHVPQQIQYSPALVQINFAQNQLELCPNLDKIKTLELVYLNNNKLKSIPNLGQGVKKAQLQQNQIKQILRQNLHKSINLQTLNLSKNSITAIQEGSFGNIRSLVILELKENRLQTFSEMPNSEKLDTLSLSFNRLTQFNYFDRCPNLTVLILSDNKIKSLSRDIIKLKKLKTLDVSNNDLSDLPCQIGFINSLVRIQVQGNPLKTMRQNIRTGGTNVIKKYLQDRIDPKQKEKLDKSVATTFEKVSQGQYWSKLLYQFTQGGELVLRKMGLTALDQLVFEKNLKGINITENKITSISQSIYKLDQLKYLIVNNNQIQHLPNSLQRLPNLQQIQAKNNQISQFIVTNPYGFSKLHYLDLSANKLKYVPKGILTLPKLRTLHLSYNGITDIQIICENPKAMPFLEILDVSNNRISDISDNIYLRVSLNYLNIQNNNLSKIPTVLGFMKLSGLKIDGNPLKLIKRAVIDKGTVAIMQYLKTRHTGQLPQRPNDIIPSQKPQYIMKPQKPNYPYQTQHKLVRNAQQSPKNNSNQTSNHLRNRSPPSNQDYQNSNPNQYINTNQAPKTNNYGNNTNFNSNAMNQQARERRVKELEAEIKKIQDQLENNMGLNNMIKNQKKKQMQTLMIEKNKILKGQQ